MKKLGLILGVVVIGLIACTGNFGIIDVNSTPSGADVFLDDSTTNQQTNCVLQDVPEGEHFIKLTLEGYAVWDTTVTVGENQTVIVDAILQIPEGALKWRYQTRYDVSSSPAIGADGTVYVGSWDDYLYAINPDGSLKWRYQTGNEVHSSPAIGTDGTIYVGSWDYYLYAINPEGSLRWRYRTGDYVLSSPAVDADGTIYIGSLDNYLYAITNSSLGLASSPWPKFHHDNMNTGRVGGGF